MNRALAMRLVALVLTTVAAIALVWALVHQPHPDADVPALNDAVRTATDAWPDVAAAPFAEGVTVIATDGRLLATTDDDPPADAMAAAADRLLSAPVVVDGTTVAQAYVRDSLGAEDTMARNAAATIASVAIGLMALVAAGLLVWTHARVVGPFERLRRFASDVASGDLDAPLEMDRGNVFGAWSESFDLMRTELAAARRREREAHESKRELVAQISHDIRTPVASISATAELMALRSEDPSVEQALGVIRGKTAQIERLMTELFQANDAQLASLSVTPHEFASTDLEPLIRAADPQGLTRIGAIAECILHGDRRRLEQVIDNVVANSAKYAGTPIDVAGRIVGPLLELTFADRGPGVPEAELSAIFGRGARGSNVGDVPGQGLGLFTSAYLMERMGGSIGAVNRYGGGLLVTVFIPLAGTLGIS